jgi:hypothetical protein
MIPTKIPVTILLVGKGMRGASRLRELLLKRSCQIECAKSVDHGLALLECQSFDLVLGGIDAEPALRSRLISSLLNCPTHLFFSLPVEDGCWWLPVVRNGQHCLGAAAVRSRDFLSTLDRLFLDEQPAQSGDERVDRPHSEMAWT